MRRSNPQEQRVSRWLHWEWPDRAWVNLLLLGGLSLLFFHPIFFNPTEMLWGNDVVRADSAFKAAIRQSLWDWKTFPLWDPTILGGRSIVGDPIYALLNPASIPFLLSSSPLLFGYFALLHVFAGSCGMYFFAKRMSCSSFGAMFAAVVFAYSGKVAAHIFAGHLLLVATVMCLPWLMLFVLRILNFPRARDVLILGLIVALTISYGTMHVLYSHALFIVACAMAFVLVGRPDRKTALLKIGALACATFVGLGLSAAVWFPAVRQTLMLSKRAGGASLQFASMGAAQLTDLLRFIWPYMGIPAPTPLLPDTYHRFFWETMAYPGIPALVLVTAAGYLLRHEKSVRIFCGIAGVFMILAFATFTPLFEIAFKFLPGFNLFRGWGRLFFYIVFVIALIAAKVLSLPAQKTKAPIFLGFFLALQFCFIGVLIFSRATQPDTSYWAPVIVLALGTTAAFLWATNMISLGVWQICFMACCVGDLLVLWHHTVQTVPVEQALPSSDISRCLARGDDTDEFRVLDTTGALQQQIAARDGIEIVGGYHPGMYASQVTLYSKIWRNDTSDATELVPHALEDIVCPSVLDLLGVRYLISSRPLNNMTEDLVQRIEGGANETPKYTYKRKTSLPRAFVVADAVLPPPGLTVADSLCSIDPRKTCLVEAAPIDGGALFQELKINRVSPAESNMTFNLPAAGMVVVSQTWHPDWRAIDGGRPASLVRVNGGLLGIPLEAGEHSLTVRYVPWDFYLGAVVSVIFVLTLAAASATRLLRTRRRYTA